MMFKRLLFVTVLITLAGVLLLGRPASSTPSEKIATRVLSETANGGSTEAIVVLQAQANLSAADALRTKVEKGRFVVMHYAKSPIEPRGQLSISCASGASPIRVFTS